MRSTILLASSLALFSLVAGVGCATPSEAPETESSESNQTSSDWSTSSIGDRPNRDVVTNERVGIAFDARGQRHTAYLGRDGKTHYVDPTSNRDEVIATNNASHHELVLDASGQPIIGFSSSDGVSIATKRNGAWAIEKVGVSGSLDALRFDAIGTLHVVTSSYATNESTATVSTRKSGQTTFEHTKVPGKLAREIGFEAFAAATDRAGTLYLFLSSFESIEDGPNRSHSGPLHGYFAKRPAGGAFTVEASPIAASCGSLAVDANNTLHAVLSVESEVADHDTKPVYIKRDPSDSSWSAPENAHWDGYYTSLAVDASGTLHLAIAGSRSRFLKYAKRPATGGWTDELITTADASVPEIALDSRGTPVIAYRDGGGYELATRRAP